MREPNGNTDPQRCTGWTQVASPEILLPIHFLSNYIIIILHRWRCSDTTCRKSTSLRAGSFFAQSNLTLQKWLILIHWWCREYPVSDAAQEAKITEKTAVQAYQYFRDICSWRLLNHDSPLMLGGRGVVVQIDESLFRHKPKVLKLILQQSSDIINY